MNPLFLTSEGILTLLVIAGLLLAIFYVLLYGREGRQVVRMSGGKQWLLRLLRIAAAAIVLLALARPAISKVKTEERTPIVPILIDESKSMEFPDSRDNPIVQKAMHGKRRYDTAQTIAHQLQEKLSLTHRVKVFTFSDTTELLKEIPLRTGDEAPASSRSELFKNAADPTGDYTHIGDAVVDTFRDLSEDKVSGIVLLTDGRQTGGVGIQTAQAQSKQFKVPVHTIVFGTEFPLRDLRIDEVVVEPEASLGDVLTFHVRITNQVSNQLRAKLTLFEEGDEVASRELNLKRGQASVAISTIPETEGTREFRLSLPQFPDEVNTENNEAVVHVKIVKRTLSVLLISGEPSREYFFMVPALLRDPVLKVSTFLQSADVDYTQQGNATIKRLPKTLKDWTKYDVCILYDADPNKITTQQMAGIENMVRKGGGLLVIAGRNHGLAKMVQVHAVKVRELLPVEIDKNQLPNYYQTFDKPFKAERTRQGKVHPIMMAANDRQMNEALWETFPEFHWSHPVQSIKSKAIVLLKKSTAGNDSGNCLMALQRFGEGAVFFSAVNSLWRWRYPYESYDYDRFWSRSIRYLGETRLKGTQQQVALSSDRKTYAPGEDVELRLQVLDPALMAQLTGQPIFASVTSPKKDVHMVQLRPDPSGDLFYEGIYRARWLGSMVARVRQAAPDADTEARPLFDVKHPFQVKMQSLENKDTSADLEAMRNLAEETGGLYFDYRNMGTVDSLIEAIPSDPQILIEQILLEIWDGWALLAVFLCFVSAEWCLRKWWGLL